MRHLPTTMALLATLVPGLACAAAAEGCPTSKDPIDTDRPDVTNSSLVVPTGSLQVENGVNLSGRGATSVADGTNTRVRLGVAPCVELLADLPVYSMPVRGTGDFGFSDVAPAAKWQLGPLPGHFELSATLGIGLPTGSRSIVSTGAQPYLQFPWSHDLGAGWRTSGMLTFFTFPNDAMNKLTTEATFVLERDVGESAFAFGELVSDNPDHAGASLLFNSGGGYRLTPTQQIDFHLGFGLNRYAPDYTVGAGYSFRLDGLFAGRK